MRCLAYGGKSNTTSRERPEHFERAERQRGSDKSSVNRREYRQTETADSMQERTKKKRDAARIPLSALTLSTFRCSALADRSIADAIKIADNVGR